MVTVHHSAPAKSNASSMKDPLLFPHDRQDPASQTEGAGPSNDVDDPPFPPLTQTQKVFMTQKEALDMSGYGDLDADDLMGALDDAEEEEEMEGLDLGGIEPGKEDEVDEKGADGGEGDQTDGGRLFVPDQGILDGTPPDDPPQDEPGDIEAEPPFDPRAAPDDELMEDDDVELPASQRAPSDQAVNRRLLKMIPRADRV